MTLTDEVPPQQVLPPLRHRADLLELELTPFEDRDVPETTYDLLVRAATRWPDATASTWLANPAEPALHVTVTNAELLERVHQIAHLLHDCGVGRTDAVTMLSPNCADMAAAILAAEAVGIASPVNPTLDPEHLLHVLALTGSRVVVAAGPALHAELWATVLAAAPALGVHTVVALDPDDGTVAALPEVEGLRVLSLRAALGTLPGAAGAVLPCPVPGADDVAAYFHTGGTTGAPKVAVHRHQNQTAMAWTIAVTSGLQPGETILAGLPLFHVNAVMVTTLAPLVVGAGGVWPGPLGYRDPAIYPAFWRIVERYRPVAMSAVPTVYANLAGIPVDADISSLRMPVVGAALLPEAVRTAFRERTGLELREGYGLTEATCASAGTPLEESQPGSVGLRMPYQRLRTVLEVDGDLVDTASGEPGEVLISGPTVFAGYLRRDALGCHVTDEGVVVDGWLRTGDLGVVEDDWLFLRGRSKDLIIRGGHNIDPAVIEDALLAHPAVTSAGAVGAPDAIAGELPVAYVVLDHPVPEDELVAWAAEHVREPAARPKQVTVLDALPVTAVGKPYKPALREDAAITVARSLVPPTVAVTAAHVGGALTLHLDGLDSDVRQAAERLSTLPLRVATPSPIEETP